MKGIVEQLSMDVGDDPVMEMRKDLRLTIKSSTQLYDDINRIALQNNLPRTKAARKMLQWAIGQYQREMVLAVVRKRKDKAKNEQ